MPESCLARSQWVCAQALAPSIVWVSTQVDMSVVPTKDGDGGVDDVIVVTIKGARYLPPLPQVSLSLFLSLSFSLSPSSPLLASSPAPPRSTLPLSRVRVFSRSRSLCLASRHVCALLTRG